MQFSFSKWTLGHNPNVIFSTHWQVVPLTLLMLIFTFSCICLRFRKHYYWSSFRLYKLVRWKSLGNWPPNFFSGCWYFCWHRLQLLPIFAQNPIPLNEVRFRSTVVLPALKHQSQGLNLLMGDEKTCLEHFYLQKIALFWWIFLLIWEEFYVSGKSLARSN